MLSARSLVARCAFALVAMCSGAGAAHAQERSVAVLEPLSRGATGVREGDLAARLVERLRESGAFARVLTPGDVSILMGELAARGLVDCAHDDCSVMDADLLGNVHTTHVVVASTAAIGQSVLVKLKLVEVQHAREVAVVVKRAPSADADAVLALAASMVPELLLQAGMPVTHAPGAPPAAAAEPAPPPVVARDERRGISPWWWVGVGGAVGVVAVVTVLAAAGLVGAVAAIVLLGR